MHLCPILNRHTCRALRLCGRRLLSDLLSSTELQYQASTIGVFKQDCQEMLSGKAEDLQVSPGDWLFETMPHLRRKPSILSLSNLGGILSN